jgi:hypothetical protein
VLAPPRDKERQRSAIRAVGLPQPKGAGSLWSTREKRTFLSRTTPHDGAEAATVKSRGTER